MSVVKPVPHHGFKEQCTLGSVIPEDSKRGLDPVTLSQDPWPDFNLVSYVLLT